MSSHVLRARVSARPRALFVVALLVLLLPARDARAAGDDPWFSVDKAKHFGVSTVLAGGGYAASALVLEPRWARATAGAAFSLTLGVGKELYDLTGRGDPSWKDLTWDVIGTAVGVGIALLVDYAVRGPLTDEPKRASPHAGSAAGTAGLASPVLRF